MAGLQLDLLPHELESELGAVWRKARAGSSCPPYLCGLKVEADCGRFHSHQMELFYGLYLCY